MNTNSPYSLKASSLIGYAGLLCEPRIQNLITRYTVLKRLTGKTMVPVLRRGNEAVNDSTEIALYVIENADVPLLPGSNAEPLCWILEDFADEWLVRWMIFSRWFHRDDIKKLEDDIADEFAAGIPVFGKMVGKLASRQLKSAGWPVGIRESNRECFERSRDRLLQGLEALFEEGAAYLFSDYPTIADFAFFGVLYQYRQDPTGRQILRIYPNVIGYIERLSQYRLSEVGSRSNFSTDNKKSVEIRDLTDLNSIFAEFLGTYWRVLVQNYRVYQRDGKGVETEVELLDGTTFEFTSSGYFVGRLKFILQHVDQAYRNRESLLGEGGLALEEPFIEHIARLTEFDAGTRLLQDYPNIQLD